jgi:hypothetical protein
LSWEGGKLGGNLPSQPPAGKLEYFLTLDDSGNEVRLPQEQNVVIRFKGAVPSLILVPHVIFMILVVIVGLRTLLEAISGRRGLRQLAWTTFLLMLVGGMIFGPWVQHYAFGAAWTGVPFGWDLTDNKTLIMFLCWLVAVLAVGVRGKVEPRGRWVVLAASLIMMIVYLIPHSMYGSELDYSKVDQGVPPEQAVGQG